MSIQKYLSKKEIPHQALIYLLWTNNIRRNIVKNLIETKVISKVKNLQIEISNKIIVQYNKVKDL